MEVFPAKDGAIRSVRIKTVDGSYICGMYGNSVCWKRQNNKYFTLRQCSFANVAFLVGLFLVLL